MSIEDKVILITGATGWLGREVAPAIARTGARLAITGRNQKTLQEVADSVNAPDERLLVHPANLADPAEVQTLMDAITARWEGVDILLNLAGGWAGGKRVAETSEDEWTNMLDRNLRTAFLINRAVLPYMVEKGWGRIVNMGSRAVENPGPRQVAYNVAKAGVVALTRSIAAEYRRNGVAANAILPAVIDTPPNREGRPDADYSQWVPPGDLTALLLFLCSEKAGSLNGASIAVHGQL
ncbi:MAG TPA: SDR family oxidoreductase [Chloroflexi bacterium]|jgi:NAD(P)-dependent dehydrogenase (short-subunit alcohol dehydrogenase family)|nr:SDR family oxidoreductase [Chloroflexota bacterium]